MNVLSRRFINFSILFHLVHAQYNIYIFVTDAVSIFPPWPLTEKSDCEQPGHDVKCY